MFVFASLLLLIASPCAWAKPLGGVPTVETERARFFLEWRSDLWTSFSQNKNSPERIYNLVTRVPVYRSEHLNGSVDIETEGLSPGQSGLTVGNKQHLVATDLLADSVGFGLRGAFEDGSGFSIFGSYDSATEQPYESARDSYVNLMGLYVFTPHGDYQWIAMLDQSKNRGYLNEDLLPMVGVRYSSDPGFTAAIGFPFVRLVWDQPDQWNALVHLTPAGFNSQYVWIQSPLLRYRVRAMWDARAYLPNQRVDDWIRLVYEEKSVDVGLKLQLSETTSIGVSIGTSFDRSLYEAKQVFLPTGPRTALGRDIYGLAHWEFFL